jgi:hypothetical protein
VDVYRNPGWLVGGHGFGLVAYADGDLKTFVQFHMLANSPWEGENLALDYWRSVLAACFVRSRLEEYKRLLGRAVREGREERSLSPMHNSPRELCPRLTSREFESRQLRA